MQTASDTLPLHIKKLQLKFGEISSKLFTFISKVLRKNPHTFWYMFKKIYIKCIIHLFNDAAFFFSFQLV